MFGDSTRVKELMLLNELEKEKWKNQRKIEYIKNKNKTKLCVCCNKELKYYSWKNHLKTKKHQENENKLIL